MSQRIDRDPDGPRAMVLSLFGAMFAGFQGRPLDPLVEPRLPRGEQLRRPRTLALTIAIMIAAGGVTYSTGRRLHERIVPPTVMEGVDRP